MGSSPASARRPSSSRNARSALSRGWTARSTSRRLNSRPITDASSRICRAPSPSRSIARTDHVLRWWPARRAPRPAGGHDQPVSLPAQRPRLLERAQHLLHEERVPLRPADQERLKGLRKLVGRQELTRHRRAVGGRQAGQGQARVERRSPSGRRVPGPVRDDHEHPAGPPGSSASAAMNSSVAWSAQCRSSQTTTRSAGARRLARTAAASRRRSPPAGASRPSGGRRGRRGRPPASGARTASPAGDPRPATSTARSIFSTMAAGAVPLVDPERAPDEVDQRMERDRLPERHGLPLHPRRPFADAAPELPEQPGLADPGLARRSRRAGPARPWPARSAPQQSGARPRVPRTPASPSLDLPRSRSAGSAAGREPRSCRHRRQLEAPGAGTRPPAR